MSRNIKLNIPQNLGPNFSKHSCLPTGRDELKIFGFQYIRSGSEISILYRLLKKADVYYLYPTCSLV